MSILITLAGMDKLNFRFLYVFSRRGIRFFARTVQALFIFVLFSTNLSYMVPATEASPGNQIIHTSGMDNQNSSKIPDSMTGPSAGSEELDETLEDLVVADGETVTVDDVRYPLVALVTAGSVFLPLADTSGFLPGQEILILTMLGEGLGTFEIAIIESVGSDGLTLSAPLLNSFDGTVNKITIQQIPIYSSVIVQPGGTLTAHAWNGATGGVVFFRSGNVTVENGGMITTKGLGYTSTNNGPGRGRGGSHGGYGGLNDTGLPYGSAFQPLTMGSAASSYSNGGGIIRIIVQETLLVDGMLSANAQDPGYYSHGSAGGSIWLTVGTLSGTGTIQVNGAKAYTLTGDHASGAGGRIAAYFTENTFDGVWSATAGEHGHIGGPGTIYLENLNTGYRKLLVDNLDRSGRQAALTDPVIMDWVFDEIALIRKGHLELLDPRDTILLTTENMAGDGTGHLHVRSNYTYTYPVLHGIGLYIKEGVTLTLPPDLIIRGAHLFNDGILQGVTDLTLTSDAPSNSLVRLGAIGNSSGQSPGTYNIETITIDADQILELAGDPNSGRGVTISATNITTAGHLSADGLGYTSDHNGPGAPTNDYSGAGHGGRGGGSAGGPTYGDYQEPITLGSAGRKNCSDGGGGIRLILTGTMEIPEGGLVSANADKAQTYCGTGAGGSIWIEAQAITGEGVVEARGGDSRYPYESSGGGGGGRIAIYADELDATIRFSINGGQSMAPGEAGTIYLGLIDPVLSSAVVEPDTIVMDGSSTGTITVTLKSPDGDPSPNQPVEVGLLSGGGISINGEDVNEGDYIDIGLTNAEGVATATIFAETIGIRTIQVRSGDVVIAQQPQVAFVAGPIDPAASSVFARKTTVPADGYTVAPIEVAIRDIYGNRVPGVTVLLAATGNASVTQPYEPTNMNGLAIGSITDTFAELVTVTATANGIPLEGEAVVEFRDTADLVVHIWGPAEIGPGSELTYHLTIDNIDVMTASDTTMTLELPPEMEYLSYTGRVEPSQDGNTLIWRLGDLSYDLQFTVTVHVSETTPNGTYLTSILTATTSTPDSNPSNNTASVATLAIIRYEFQAAIRPTVATLSSGGSATCTITINNKGYSPDNYALSLTGLDPTWVSFNRTAVSLSPGDFTDVTLILQPPGCQAETTLPFTVAVESVGKGEGINLEGQVILTLAPQITLESPAQDAISGARTVLFHWRTQPATTGKLTLYPAGDPGNAQTFDTPEGDVHSVQAEDLTREVTYEWYVEGTSACGAATSEIRTFTVGSGIVFTDRNPSFTIERDYSQIVRISVRNDDSAAHELLATVQNPYTDLILNFVGSGSVDQVVTLGPGESKTLELSIHAQDAEAREYNLVAVITADEGTGTPLKDTTTVHLTVLAEADFTITEIDVNPITGTKTYKITNNGKTLTDLSIGAIDPSTGLPARVFITPTISHARLATDQSLTFRLIPLFDESDLPEGSEAATTLTYISNNLSGNSSPNGTLAADIVVSSAGVSQTHSTQMGCPTGEVHAVTLEDVCLALANGDWYCTNRPEISVPLTMPYFIGAEDIGSLDLHVTINPKSNVLPHTTSFAMNGQPVGSLENMIPDGTYSTKVPVSALNFGGSGPVVQRLDLTSQHENGGHYVVATDFVLGVGMDSVTAYVCATSQDDAYQNAVAAFDLEPRSLSDACAAIGIPIDATWASGDELCNAINGTQLKAGGPINTRTGGTDYSFVDLSVPTSAGPLSFQRWYATLSTEAYTDILGYGWTHSLDTRLIFPEDPEGRDGVVLLKAHSSNRYEFTINEDGTYTATPGICGMLTQEGDPPTYTFTDDSQRSYLFDEDGKLLTLANPQGNALHYTYDVEKRLTKVSDDTGDRYLELTYDSQGHISIVSDHAGRQASFSYDASGDLISATDILGQVWAYAYDTSHPHYLSEVIDPDGVTVERTEYDSEGRAVRQYNGEGELVVELKYSGLGTTKVYDGLGNEQSHTYDSNNAIQRQANSLGGINNRKYDGNYRPTNLVDPAGNESNMTWDEEGVNLTQLVDPEGNLTSFNYDDLNNLTTATDPLGFSTSFTYEGALITSATSALGASSTYTYTPEGFLASETDPLGNTTLYSYDDYGQLLSMTDPMGNTWSFTYDDLGRMIEVTDPLDRIVRTEYDVAGQMIRTIVNYDPSRPQNDSNQYNITTEYLYDSVGNQIGVVDTYGRSTGYEYDQAGRLVRKIDPRGNVSAYAYDVAGNLLSTTDALGRITTLEYDEMGRLIAVLEPLDETTTTTYNSDDTVASVTDPLGRRTTYQYDGLKRMVSIRDPLGNTRLTTYDEVGNVIATTDELGRRTQYEYDGIGRLIREINPLGGVTQHEYDASSNRIRTVDPNGNATIYSYDSLNRLGSVTDALGNITTYKYDAIDNLITITDANGNTTSYSYDALGRQVSVVNPLGDTSTTAYDALGNVISQTDPNGNATTFDYDELNRIILQTDPLGGETTFTYDAVGNQTSITDANGNNTTYTYDPRDRLIEVTDANGNSTFTSYDKASNVITVKDALANVTTYVYDELNRQVTITDPLGNSTHYAYDAVGNQISMTNPESVVTKYEYDGLNRLVAVVENSQPGFSPDHETNVRTEYSFDAVSNLIAITDANGNMRTFSYDALNRQVSESDPLGNTTNNVYDAVGNHVSTTDAEGFTTYFVNDAANRLVKIDYPEPDADVTFNYDPAGRRVSMTDGAGTTSWTYDALDRLIASSDPNNATVSYAYDAVGNRISLTYPDGKVTNYTYDPSNQMIQVTDWDGLVTAYKYDVDGRLTTMTLPIGVASSFSYDDAGQLLVLEHATETELLSSFEYTYDAVGNRLQVVETMLWSWKPTPIVPSSPGAYLPETSPAGQLAADPLMVMMAPLVVLVALSSRLRRRGNELPKGVLVLVIIVGLGLGVSACIPIPTPRPTITPTPSMTPTLTPSPIPTDTPTPSPTPEPTPVVTATTINYTYDPLYRLTAADYDSSEFFHYSYDAVGNRLTQETHNGTNIYTFDAVNRLIEVDSVPYTWSANGNLLNDGLSNYSYDHANRLTVVEEGSDIYTFTYNGLGDRLGQMVNESPTSYVLDQAVGLRQVLSDGTNDYLYGLGRIGERGSTGWSYHLVDALGSVRQTVDEATTVAMTRAYEPFGASLLSAGNASTDYGFAGEWTDTSGLIHLRARYYDPLTGRFMQPDPWRGSNLQPASLHPYLYGSNNPILFCDPSGRCYGVLSFLRDIEPQNCRNLDMAHIIGVSDQTSLTEKFIAGLYAEGMLVSHTAMAAGVFLLNPAWATVGVAYGGVQAGVKYGLATSGACGCEVQREVERLGVGYIGRGAAQGMVGGGLLGPIYARGGWGKLAVGTLGVLLSGAGLYASGRNIIEGFRSGDINACNFVDAGSSIVGLVLSRFAIKEGVNALIEQYLGNLGSFGVPPELQPPGVTGQWRNWPHQQEIISEPSGEFYSVAHEMKLDPVDIGTSHGVHILRAMTSIKTAMQSDPAFAADLESISPGAIEAIAAGKNPPGWVWHHAVESGIMQLVPVWQHTSGTQFWFTMHPGGRGGWSIWAVPAGAKPR